MFRGRWPGADSDPAGRAGLITAAVLTLVLAARVGAAIGNGEQAQVPFTAALFVLPLLYAFPGPRGRLAGHRWAVLAIQAVLTCVPFAVFGARWDTGVSGLLAALVLLMLPPRRAWPLAAVLLAAEVVVRAVLVGLGPAPAWAAVTWVIVYFVDDGLILFGLARLADLVAQEQSMRGQFAVLAVGRERLRAAEEVQAVIGGQLTGVAARVTAARRALPGAPGRARAQVESAGAAARHAAARARDVATTPSAVPMPAVIAVIAPRLAWIILVAESCGLQAGLLLNVRFSGLAPAPAAVLIGSSAGLLGLQLYQSRPRPGDGRPRAWPLTLAAQTILAFVPFMLVPAHYVGSIAGFPAGSVLLLVRGRWRWAGFGAIVASWLLLYVAVAQTGLTPHPGPDDILYVAALSAGVGLLVYGLSRLAGTARQLEQLRGDLARLAALRERLRVARDVHDLLGLGLSAIALKSDLITRLLARDDPRDRARAAAELDELSRICARARADVRVVTAGAGAFTMTAELGAARELLVSAGIAVRAEADAGPWPEAAGAVLAPVLREAVTNVLRHAAARTCVIELTVRAGLLTLHVGNDGVPGRGHREGGDGHGLGNLTARVAAAGGCLTTSQAAGRFDLYAELPHQAAELPHRAQPARPVPPASQPPASQPPGLGRDPDRVHPVAGAELGDR